MPVVVGVVLRLDQLPQQILVDDEWHMVHALRDGASLASIVGDFGSSDHSIGLSVVAWLVMRLTAVDELTLRLPALIAGVALLLAMPAWLSPMLGRPTAVTWAWLLAVSPLLCFFSRLARPYAVTTLLVTVATGSFYAWALGRGGRRAAWAYVASAALVPVFHLPALPAALAPFGLLAMLPGDSAGARRPSLARAAGLLLATVALMIGLLAVPIAASGRRVLGRLGTDRLRLETLPGTAELLAGTSAWWVIVVLGGLGLVGIVSLHRRNPLWVRYLALVIAVQAAAVAASGAVAMHVPIVLARYLAVVLPLLLLFPAAGLAAAAGLLGGGRRPLVAATVLGAGAAFALYEVGPLPWIHQPPNAFTNHISYQADYAPGRYFERFRPREISAFHTDVLGALAPGSVTIVEAPWYFYFHSFAYTQRLHRQHVVIGFVGGAEAPPRGGEVGATDPGIRLRNALALDDVTGLRSRGVRYVVLHRDVLAEIRWPAGVAESPVDMGPWIERQRALFGPPVFEDAQLVVFAIGER